MLKHKKKKNSGVFCPLIGTNFWLYTQLPKILIFEVFYAQLLELCSSKNTTPSVLNYKPFWSTPCLKRIKSGGGYPRISATDFGGYGCLPQILADTDLRYPIHTIPGGLSPDWTLLALAPLFDLALVQKEFLDMDAPRQHKRLTSNDAGARSDNSNNSDDEVQEVNEVGNIFEEETEEEIPSGGKPEPAQSHRVSSKSKYWLFLKSQRY